MEERPHTKFKELSFNEKTEYIWDYFKLPIFGGIFLVIVLVTLLNHFVINPPAKTIYDVSVLMEHDFTVLHDYTEAVEFFNELLIEDGKNEKVNIEFINMSKNLDPNDTMANTTKLAAKVQINELDVMLVDKGSYEDMIESEALVGLDGYLEGQEVSKDSIYVDGKLMAIEVSSYQWSDMLIPIEYDKVYLVVHAGSGRDSLNGQLIRAYLESDQVQK